MSAQRPRVSASTRARPARRNIIPSAEQPEQPPAAGGSTETHAAANEMARETGARIARECGASRRAGGGPPPRVARRDERADGGRARRGVGGPTVVAPYGEWRARDWRVAVPPDP